VLGQKKPEGRTWFDFFREPIGMQGVKKAKKKSFFLFYEIGIFFKVFFKFHGQRWTLQAS